MTAALGIVIWSSWLAAGTPGTLSPEDQRAVAQRAQAAYDEATSKQSTTARAAFRTAAENYQILVDDGIRNGRLFYNLGNARLQCGDLGLAILNYRRAAALIPNDDQLQHNLAYARSLRRNHIPLRAERTLVRSLLAWHFESSPDRRWQIGLCCYVLFWVLLMLRWLRPQIRWSFGAVPCLVVWLAMAASLAADNWRPPAPAGVLTADNVAVLKGNGADFQRVFAEPLHQGVEFTVVEIRDQWWHIELPDGQRGWIRADQAGRV